MMLGETQRHTSRQRRLMVHTIAWSAAAHVVQYLAVAAFVYRTRIIVALVH